MPDFYVQVSVFILLVLSLGLHEAAHARVASFFGDPTPAIDGVNTWNPVPHIRRAFFTCVILPAIAWFAFGFFIGGAFVMLNPAFMRPRKLGYFCAVAAGPGMNLLLSILFAAIGLVTVKLQNAPVVDQNGFLNPLVTVFFACSSFNMLLVIFNLIPLPPLDGSSLAVTLFPGLRPLYDAIRGYGLLIVILLLNLTRLGYYLSLLIESFRDLLILAALHLAPQA